MKHVTSLLLAFVIVLFTGISLTVNAQLPEVGVEYYIENGCMPKQNNGIERTGLLVTDASAADVNITVDNWNIIQNKGKQIWTVTSEGYIVNTLSGRKLVMGSNSKYSTNDTGAKFTFAALSSPEGFVTITREGQSTNKFSAYNGPSGWNLFDQSKPGFEEDGTSEGSPRAWKFIPVAEYESRYPILSTETVEKWYFINNCTKTGKVLAVSGTSLALEDKSPATDPKEQLWKVVAASGDNKVYFINKSTGQYLGRSGSAPALLATAPTVPLAIKVVRGDEFSLTWRDDDGRPSIVANAISNAIVTGEPYYKVEGTTWYFNPATQTSMAELLLDQLQVYARDGYIRLVNSHEPFEVYSVTGNKKNAAQKLSPGVYIVKVAGQTVKVSVK